MVALVVAQIHFAGVPPFQNVRPAKRKDRVHVDECGHELALRHRELGRLWDFVHVRENGSTPSGIASGLGTGVGSEVSSGVIIPRGGHGSRHGHRVFFAKVFFEGFFEGNYHFKKNTKNIILKKYLHFCALPPQKMPALDGPNDVVTWCDDVACTLKLRCPSGGHISMNR